MLKFKMWTNAKIRDKFDDILLDRLNHNVGTIVNLAWCLADGNHITLQTCNLGYLAMVFDIDYVVISYKLQPCNAINYPADVLLAHAASQIGSIDVTDAVPICYEDFMEEARSECLYDATH
ncbi:MAG: hypothetical protein LUG27_03415 [Clostridiales bacterium]|nr:hypothetical protein [Clostridiales bacterium]